VGSYRKLGPFFFLLLLSNTGRRGRSNKQEERKEYKGGFQECTHKKCRNWGQPFWSKMHGLSDWLSFGLLKLPKKERREENLYFFCGTELPTN
jgi:hypothetical protein